MPKHATPSGPAVTEPSIPAAVDLPPELTEGWQAIADTLAKLADVPAALVMRLRGEDIEVFVRSDSDDNPYHVGDREEFFDSGLYCETVIREDQVLLVPDAPADPDWATNPDVELGMISYLGLPIRFPDGRPFGTICILDRKENAYSQAVLELLGHFRDLIEDQIEVHSLNLELRRRVAQLEKARERIGQLESALPVCAWCGDIHAADGRWEGLEAYLERREGARVTHAICPACEGRNFPQE